MSAGDGGGTALHSLAADAAQELRRLSGHPPEGIWRSPGRVNLIGEHTDYNDGLALPFAIDRATWVAARRREDRVVHVRSTDLDREVNANLSDVGSWEAERFPRWARYPLGVVQALHQIVRAPHHSASDLPGADFVISSNIPRGAGLSSSAALTVPVAMALAELMGVGLDRLAMARLAQQAESSFAGVPCGLLDQISVLEAKARHAVLVDFSSLSVRQVPLGGGPMVVVDTRVERDNSSGAYADRRGACQKAAAQLGLRSLREASLAQVESELGGALRKRARHVVTENARVEGTVGRLQQHCCIGSIGDLLVASHISLRDDFEVSCPELDLVVETALANGADGARLTGAGLGGCAITIGADALQLATPLSRAFAAAGFGQPEVYQVTPSDGAGRVA
ncbi:MAG: galactokinase [Acidimicrobiales bacterium]